MAPLAIFHSLPPRNDTMARFSATLCLISIAVAACAAPASAFWSAEDQGTTDVDALISGIGNGLWHSAGLYLTFPVNASEAKVCNMAFRVALRCCIGARSAVACDGCHDVVAGFCVDTGRGLVPDR